MKYQSRTKIIEAIQYKNYDSVVKMCEQWGESFENSIKICNISYELIIKTLEGDHIARVNDYIIKGIRGEFYPCKPDIFEESYCLVI